MRWFLNKFTATILIGSLGVLAFQGWQFVFPQTAQAVTNTQIRQEINIIDGYMYADSGSFATSSAIVQTAASSTYTGNTAYFEIVASTTAGTVATVNLVNATSSASTTSITINGGNTYMRYRSASFTLPDAATEYKVRLNNEATGKGIIAARIVILQSAATLLNTETQIEVGNQETFSGTATTTFASPKYWYYNAAGWDGSPTFYAEITYQVMNGAMASTSVYTAAGTYTVTLPGGTASSTIGLWGGGGSGGSSTLSPGGGSGGAGGQFASSTLIATTSSHTLVVAAGAVAPSTPNGGTQGATSTWDGAMIVAGGGGGGLIDGGASTTGITFGCVGTSCFAGGAGGAGHNPSTEYGGGGGGGADSSGTGNSATGAGVAGAAKGFGGAGAVKNVTAPSAGTTGGTAGGGGSGGNSSAATDKAGGAGGIGRGQIYNFVATSTIVLQSDDGNFGSWTDVAGTYMVNDSTLGGGQPTRVRTNAFTATDGKHYRIALRKNDTRTSIALYNAKIVVDQGGNSTISSYSVNTTNLQYGATLTGGGQAFAGANGILKTATFALEKTGSPTGNAVANLYAVSGALGSAIPTGAPLATSNTLDVSTVTLSYVNYTFDFSASPYTLVSGTNYVIAVEHTGDSSNHLLMGESTTGLPSGNRAVLISGVWSSNNTVAVDHTVTISVVPTLLEPQYQLANTKFVTGNGLQNFLTSFDPTEWSTTNNYLHAVSSGASEASTIELDNTIGPTQIGGSVVTSPNNYATSTGMCLSSSATLDTKATTNGGNVFGDSIIVQVGVASTATGCGGTPSGTPARLNIIQVQVILRNGQLKIQ